jgi:hypothetical protein
MSRPEPMDLVTLAGGPLPTPSPLGQAWECPGCHLVVWNVDGTPRCRRCGFWDTAS